MVKGVMGHVFQPEYTNGIQLLLPSSLVTIHMELSVEMQVDYVSKTETTFIFVSLTLALNPFLSTVRCISSRNTMFKLYTNYISFKSRALILEERDKKDKVL